MRTALPVALILCSCATAHAPSASVVPPEPPVRVIHVVARQFAYSPARIEVRTGETVDLELVSADHEHGFNLPEFNVRADVEPGAPTRVRLTPQKSGTFPFHCDVFCGSGHEEMEGELVVVDGPRSE